MSRVRKNHPVNFKAKFALAALSKDAPISELASKYGVHAAVIHRWKREGWSTKDGYLRLPSGEVLA